MTAVDQSRIAALFSEGDNAATPAARGRALEEIIVYLFELIPGVRFTIRNGRNVSNSEEIDVAFWNDRHPDGLHFFDHIILVECKNWSAPVGSQELTIFNDKLQSRGRPMGIFVAAAGITGDPSALTAAHSVLARALTQHREILVVTRREIEKIIDTKDLVELLQRKLVQLAAAGTIFQL